MGFLQRLANMIMGEARRHGGRHHRHHHDQHQVRDDNFSSGSMHYPRQGHHGHGHRAGGGWMSYVRKFLR